MRNPSAATEGLSCNPLQGNQWDIHILLMAPNTREGRQKAEEIAVQELATRKIEPQIPSVQSWITVNHILDGFLRHSRATYEWYEWFFSTFKLSDGSATKRADSSADKCLSSSVPREPKRCGVRGYLTKSSRERPWLNLGKAIMV